MRVRAPGPLRSRVCAIAQPDAPRRRNQHFSAFPTGLRRRRGRGWRCRSDDASHAAHPRLSLQEDAMQTSPRSSSSFTSVVRQAACGLVLVALTCAPAASQTLPPIAKEADLSGPRFGVTLLSDGVIDELAKRDIAVGPHISQFGWQFEKQFFTKGGPV